MALIRDEEKSLVFQDGEWLTLFDDEIYGPFPDKEAARARLHQLQKGYGLLGILRQACRRRR